MTLILIFIFDVIWCFVLWYFVITVFENGYVSELATGPFVCSFWLLLILYSRCFSPIQLNFKMRFPVQVEDRSPGASTPPGEGGVSPPRDPHRYHFSSERIFLWRKLGIFWAESWEWSLGFSSLSIRLSLWKTYKNLCVNCMFGSFWFWGQPGVRIRWRFAQAFVTTFRGHVSICAADQSFLCAGRV